MRAPHQKEVSFVLLLFLIGLFWAGTGIFPFSSSLVEVFHSDFAPQSNPDTPLTQ